MPPGIKAYMISYACLSALALVAGVFCWRRLTIFHGSYWSFLLRPWKLVSFVVLALAITLPAPFMDISSWDVPICVGQSILSFVFAPWAIAVLARAARSRRPTLEAALALCVLFVISCWAVEVYILVRDGSYMRDWDYNYLASPPSFIAVGLLWNVERAGEGYSFAFLREAWPEPPTPGGSSS